MDIPYSTEIRAQRAIVERGLQARQVAQEIEVALTSLGMGSFDVQPQQLLDRVGVLFPELQLDGDLFSSLSTARLSARQLIAAGEKANRQLAHLLEHQWQELRKPEWSDTRAELAELSDKRTALHTSLAPVVSMVSALGPLATATDEQLALIREDEAAGGAHEQRARARMLGLVEAIETTLTSVGTAAKVPEAPGFGNPDLRAAIDELAEFNFALRKTLDGLAERHDALSSELSSIETAIRTRTG